MFSLSNATIAPENQINRMIVDPPCTSSDRAGVFLQTVKNAIGTSICTLAGTSEDLSEERIAALIDGLLQSIQQRQEPTRKRSAKKVTKPSVAELYVPLVNPSGVMLIVEPDAFFLEHHCILFQTLLTLNVMVHSKKPMITMNDNLIALIIHSLWGLPMVVYVMEEVLGSVISCAEMVSQWCTASMSTAFLLKFSWMEETARAATGLLISDPRPGAVRHQERVRAVLNAFAKDVALKSAILMGIIEQLVELVTNIVKKKLVSNPSQIFLLDGLALLLSMLDDVTSSSAPVFSSIALRAWRMVNQLSNGPTGIMELTQGLPWFTNRILGVIYKLKNIPVVKFEIPEQPVAD